MTLAVDPTAPLTFEVALPDGAVLRAQVEGAGPPLLLLSGLGGTAGFWDPVAAQLAAQARVIRFDQRGIGASTRGSAAPVDIALLASDARAVMDAAGVAQAAILGHSTGGCIAQQIAAEAPARVSALILSASWGGPSRYMQALFTARRALLDADPVLYASSAALLAYPPAWLEAHWHVHEAACAKAPQSAAARAVVAERIAALCAYDGRGTPAPAALPCLVLGCADDMIVPASAQQALAASRPGARLHLLPEGGHFFPHVVPEAFLSACLGFLRASGTTGSESISGM